MLEGLILTFGPPDPRPADKNTWGVRELNFALVTDPRLLLDRLLTDWLAGFPWDLTYIGFGATTPASHAPKPFSIPWWDKWSIWMRATHELAHVIYANDDELTQPGWGLGVLPDDNFALTKEQAIREAEVIVISSRLFGHTDLEYIVNAVFYAISGAAQYAPWCTMKFIGDLVSSSKYLRMSERELWEERTRKLEVVRALQAQGSFA